MKVTSRVIFTKETVITPETVERSWWSEPLIGASCDCEMKKVLDEALSLLAGHPKILGRIEADQDAVGKAKKKVRAGSPAHEAGVGLRVFGLARLFGLDR